MDNKATIEDLLKIQNIFNQQLTKLHWFYSPFHFYNSIVDFEKIYKINSDVRQSILVLDRNILSRLINIASKGTTSEGSIQDIAILISWSAINNIGILPYFALNEFAEGTSELSAQKEYNIFQKIYTDIPLVEWLAIALGFEKENKTLLCGDFGIISDNIEFCNTSVDYLSNYAAMLHLSTILLSENDQISRFKKFFKWFYDTLKVSRYTEVYVCSLLSSLQFYKEPKKIHGKNLHEAIKGCQNQARDLSYLTQLSIDRWPIEEYEPILVSDDQMLGDIFEKGCFNTEAIRIFEKSIKSSNKKISLWVNELLSSHQEVTVNNYESYCKEIVKQELTLFENTFNSIHD